MVITITVKSVKLSKIFFSRNYPLYDSTGWHLHGMAFIVMKMLDWSYGTMEAVRIIIIIISGLTVHTIESQ